MVLLVLNAWPSLAQKINVPLDQAKNELWRQVPTELTGNAIFDDNIHCKEGVDVMCCFCALQRVRAGTNKIAFDEGIQAGIKAASEIGKLLLKIGPFEKEEKFLFDLLSAVLKVETTQTDEERMQVMEKEAAKLMGKKAWDDLPEEIKNGLNEALKQILDKLMDDLCKQDVNKDIGCYNAHFHFKKKDNVTFTMYFEFSGKCNCEKCTASHDWRKLDEFKVVGHMTGTMVDIKPVVRGALWWKKTEYDVTLKWGTPEFWISASCDCPGGSGPGTQTVPKETASRTMAPCYNYSASTQVAYNFPMSGGLLGTDNNNGTVTGVYGSMGEGTTVGGTFGYMFSNAVSALFAVNYFMGSTVKVQQVSIGSGYSSEYNYEGKPSMVRLSLGGRANVIRRSNCNTGFIPFIGFGVNLGVCAKEKVKESSTDITGTISNYIVSQSEMTFKTSFGGYGEAGTKYNINRRCSVFAAGRFNLMSIIPDKWVLNSRSVNGQDITGQLPISQKETDYKRELPADANSNINVPHQAIANPVPASSLSIEAGFIFNF